MVTDRVITVTRGALSVTLTTKPYSVQKTEGFDTVEVTNVASQGSDQDGATDINSYVNPRPLKIVGQVKASTTTQMQNYRDRLQNIFVPKEELTIKHYYGGKQRVITAKVEKTPEFEFTDVTQIQNYEVNLKASMPYWRDMVETSVPIANWWGMFHFPLVIPKVEGVAFGVKSPSLIADVYNGSVITIGMRFVFVATGAVTNPQLFNVNTREFFRLLCSMDAGEEIEVCTGDEKTVTRTLNGNTEDYIGKIDLDGGGYTFLELAPGDNLFRYSADSGEDSLEVRIYYNNRYMGV